MSSVSSMKLFEVLKSCIEAKHIIAGNTPGTSDLQLNNLGEGKVQKKLKKSVQINNSRMQHS